MSANFAGRVQERPEEGFKPVQGGDIGVQDTIPAATLVGIAYGFIWLVVVLYLVQIWRKNRRTEQEITDLRGKIDRLAGGPSGKASGSP